jgi:sigma-B regulation protein RsbU (phosphoserine phosphatase)
MARISSELRATALAHVEPAAVLAAMNSAILARDQPDLFFTVVYLTLDVRSGEIVLANAGHPPPYLLRHDGSVHAVTDGASSAVGILEEPAFRATRVALGDGDSLLLCTDGVVEAADGNGELYGTQRLESCLVATGPHPEALAKRLLRSVEEFAAGGTENDDLTLFICHRRAGQQASLQPKARNRSVDRPPR